MDVSEDTVQECKKNLNPVDCSAYGPNPNELSASDAQKLLENIKICKFGTLP